MLVFYSSFLYYFVFSSLVLPCWVLGSVLCCLVLLVVFATPFCGVVFVGHTLLGTVLVIRGRRLRRRRRRRRRRRPKSVRRRRRRGRGRGKGRGRGRGSGRGRGRGRDRGRGRGIGFNVLVTRFSVNRIQCPPYHRL